MMTLYVSLKLLKKQFWATLITVAQIVLSLVFLSSLLVVIFTNEDNLRSLDELPRENAAVFTPFSYYEVDEVREKLSLLSYVESIGEVCYKADVPCNGKACNFIAYSDGLIRHYAPALFAGGWLTEEAESGEAIPAVVSADLKLHVGDTVSVPLTEDTSVTIYVQGILKKPTQYLFPIGSAAPEYFSTDMIIGNDTAIIVPAERLGSLSGVTWVQTGSCFVFSQNGSEALTADETIQRLGLVSSVDNMISLYKETTENLILTWSALFAVFFLLAITSVISTNVIQSRQSQRIFTVYYLLGMDWKQGIAIELLRNAFVILLAVAVSYVCGLLGAYSLIWLLNDTRIRIFYAVVFAYVGVLLVGASALFLRKLLRQDISTALKNLHQGE